MYTTYEIPAEATGRHDLSDLIAERWQDPEDVWSPDYGIYDQAAIEHKFKEIAAALVERGEDPQQIAAELEASLAFNNHVFSEYQSDSVARLPGSYAFVVPTRAVRAPDSYVNEWDQFHPLIRRIDPATAQLALVGTPPYVVDTYGEGPDGRQGYMTFAPFFDDMMRDIPPEILMRVATKVMNDGIRFAGEQLGSKVVGLGATLPKLLFAFRKAQERIEIPDGVSVTSGHAGTVWLIGETLKEAEKPEYGFKGLSGKVGIIGAGSIGRATAVHLRQGLGYGDRLMISDKYVENLAKVGQDDRLNHTAEVVTTLDNADVLRNCDTIVCAITERIDLEKIGISPEDIEGKLIIDDSQPGCLSPEQVDEMGGTLSWVIGQDTTEGGLITNQSFHYSGYGPAEMNQAWGCQLEAAVLALSGRTDLAVDHDVRPEDVSAIGQLMQEFGIHSAPLQRYGQYIRK